MSAGPESPRFGKAGAELWRRLLEEITAGLAARRCSRVLRTGWGCSFSCGAFQSTDIRTHVLYNDRPRPAERRSLPGAPTHREAAPAAARRGRRSERAPWRPEAAPASRWAAPCCPAPLAMPRWIGGRRVYTHGTRPIARGGRLTSCGAAANGRARPADAAKLVRSSGSAAGQSAARRRRRSQAASGAGRAAAGAGSGGAELEAPGAGDRGPAPGGSLPPPGPPGERRVRGAGPAERRRRRAGPGGATGRSAAAAGKRPPLRRRCLGPGRAAAGPAGSRVEWGGRGEGSAFLPDAACRAPPRPVGGSRGCPPLLAAPCAGRMGEAEAAAAPVPGERGGPVPDPGGGRRRARLAAGGRAPRGRAGARSSIVRRGARGQRRPGRRGGQRGGPGRLLPPPAAGSAEPRP